MTLAGMVQKVPGILTTDQGAWDWKMIGMLVSGLVRNLNPDLS